jgi:hypothetical protein
MTRKKTRAIPCSNSPRDYSMQVTNFLQSLDAYRTQKKTIVAIDETGFNDNSLPLSGYSLKGKRLTINHNRRQWSKTSAIASVSSTGNYSVQLINNSVKGYDFACFFETLNFPSDTVMLMDNIAFHKSKRVQTIANKNNWILLYTPPYSPWFDPIENVFSVVKHEFRHLNSMNIFEESSVSSRREIALSAFERAINPDLIYRCFESTYRLCENFKFEN